jgi:hypothetical protein
MFFSLKFIVPIYQCKEEKKMILALIVLIIFSVRQIAPKELSG